MRSLISILDFSVEELDKLIGWDFNWNSCTGTNNGLWPHFETKVLEILPDGSHRVQNHVGLIEKVKPGISSIPSEDDYLLKDREAFETLYRPKMQFDPARINYEYFKHFNETRDMETPIALHLGSVMGQIRDIVSVVGMSYLMYDEDEDLFADIVDTYADMQTQHFMQYGKQKFTQSLVVSMVQWLVAKVIVQMLLKHTTLLAVQ